MRVVRNILLWVLGISGLVLLLNFASESDRKDCEELLARELNTTAVYINNHCMVKGYGRADGR